MVAVSQDLICEVVGLGGDSYAEIIVRTRSDGEKLWSVQFHLGFDGPSAIALAASRTLYTARRQKETFVRRRNLQSLDVLEDVFAVRGRSFDRLAVDRTGCRFLTFGDGGLELWEIEDASRSWPSPGAAAVAASGDRIVQVVGDHVHVRSMEERTLSTMRHELTSVKAVAVDASGTAFAASDAEDNLARVATWRLEDGQQTSGLEIKDCGVFIEALAVQRRAAGVFVSTYG